MVAVAGWPRCWRSPAGRGGRGLFAVIGTGGRARAGRGSPSRVTAARRADGYTGAARHRATSFPTRRSRRSWPWCRRRSATTASAAPTPSSGCDRIPCREAGKIPVASLSCPPTASLDWGERSARARVSGTSSPAATRAIHRRPDRLWRRTAMRRRAATARRRERALVLVERATRRRRDRLLLDAPFDGSPWLYWTFADAHMLVKATTNDRDFGDALRLVRENARFIAP